MRLKVFLLFLGWMTANAGTGLADAADPAARHQFVKDRLRDAVLVYDRHLRVAGTGQYLDAVQLDGTPNAPRSSIASTGMGLIGLAIGHAIGAIPDAEEKAVVTLAHLLGKGGTDGFSTERSQSGWYRHWFDANTGDPSDASREKFSTIDTAILGAGAAIAGSYFRDAAAAAGRPGSQAAALARELLMSVDWTMAIRNPERGSIHLVFYGHEERPTETVATIPFDEYALLPCIAARYEAERGVKGDATMVWQALFDMADELPMLDHGDLTLLGKPTGSVPSHFTHQFVFHLCKTYARDPEFLNEMRELMAADRMWFAKRGVPSHLWGLGAGSELILEEDEMVAARRYGVARLGKNPNHTASPAIMAGFLAVDVADEETGILRDLMTLWERGECRYSLDGIEFLWRCSAKDPAKPVARVEGIDFSTWMLGLATAHPDLGLRFFQRHGV